jgi:hypothetical protein
MIDKIRNVITAVSLFNDVNKDTAVITFRILSIIQHQYHDINKDTAVITFHILSIIQHHRGTDVE